MDNFDSLIYTMSSAHPVNILLWKDCNVFPNQPSNIPEPFNKP